MAISKKISSQPAVKTLPSWRTKFWFGALLAVAFVSLSAIFSIAAYTALVSEDWRAGENLFEGCNVLALDVRGHLVTYLPPSLDGEEDDATSSENLTYLINLAQKDPDIKAILLSIDSGGGDPVAGEEVAFALRRTDKPSLAVIRGLGASAAYWAATGANRILASRLSEVGGLGVTASYLDESGKNQKDGYAYTELSSAEYKDVGDPARPLSDEERELILADLVKMHEIFVGDVARHRGLEADQVRELANGLTYLGEDALAYGLIDGIGDLASADLDLARQIGEPVNYCWY